MLAFISIRHDQLKISGYQRGTCAVRFSKGDQQNQNSSKTAAFSPVSNNGINRDKKIISKNKRLFVINLKSGIECEALAAACTK